MLPLAAGRYPIKPRSAGHLYVRRRGRRAQYVRGSEGRVYNLYRWDRIQGINSRPDPEKTRPDPEKKKSWRRKSLNFTTVLHLILEAELYDFEALKLWLDSYRTKGV